MSTIALEPVDGVTITTLVDNAADMLLPNQGPAKRPGLGAAGAPRLAAAFLEGGETLDAPLAEHGFSALITVQKEGNEHRVLFDAGLTPDGLIDNMRRLSLSPKDLEAIVLSHGHFDHTTGLDGLVRALGRPNLPVIIHPEFWNRRRILIPGREPFELFSTSRTALRGAGFEIVEEARPSFLLDGSLLVTGEVDRTTEFERGFPIHQAYRDGEWQPDPLILDDPAVGADHTGHLRGARRAGAGGHRPRPLHRLASRSRPGRAVPGRLHPEHRRHPLGAIAAIGQPRRKTHADPERISRGLPGPEAHRRGRRLP